MAHLKKDFKRHKLFNNKYADQTYLAYLCRGNKRYIARSGDNIPSFVIATIDFIIKCNNHICRRGDEKTAVANIKKEYENDRDIFGYAWISPIRKYYNRGVPEKNDFEATRLVKELLNQIQYWDDKFENNYDGFKDFIYNEMANIINNHYDWVVGDNIIYDRSIRDNIQKRVYCSLGNENVVPKFKAIYFENVYVEPKDKAKLYKQIDYLLTTIADVNNYLLTKENVKAIELLQDYFDDNEKMETCKDIYYLKIYYQLHDVYNLLSQGKNHDGLVMVQKIIEKENNKYITSFTLFESVAIDLENSTYAKIVNI